eukprot:2685605-Pyramimonas_sp.AAC.1
MHSTPQKHTGCDSIGSGPGDNITSFYGSSCANNGKGALDTPDGSGPGDRLVRLLDNERRKWPCPCVASVISESPHDWAAGVPGESRDHENEHI